MTWGTGIFTDKEPTLAVVTTDPAFQSDAGIATRLTGLGLVSASPSLWKGTYKGVDVDVLFVHHRPGVLTVHDRRVTVKQPATVAVISTYSRP